MSKKIMSSAQVPLPWNLPNISQCTPIYQEDIARAVTPENILSDRANAITNIGGVTFTEISTLLERIDKRETVDTHMLKLIIKYYKEFIINDLSTEEHLTNEQILLKAYLEGQK